MKKTILILFAIVSTILVGVAQTSTEYEQKIEDLLGQYPSEYHDFLRGILVRWEEEGKPWILDDAEGLKKTLDEFYESEKRLVEEFKHSDQNQKNKGFKKFHDSRLPTDSAYNQPGFEFNHYPDTRHLGTRLFENSYAYLVRIKKPEKFDLKHNQTRPMLGQYLDQASIENAKEDRNQIYDLFRDALPPLTDFRIQDVFQRHEDYLFVRFETAYGDIEPEQVLSLPVIDKLYHCQRIMPRTRSQTYDGISGKTARIKRLRDSWNKESTYQVLKKILSKPEYGSAWVKIEITSKAIDTGMPIEERLQSLVTQDKGYNQHPYSQFSSPINPEDSLTPNPSIVEYSAITLEHLEVLYQSDEIVNITPKI